MVRYYRRIELEEEDQIALDGGLILHFRSLYLRRERTDDVPTSITYFSDRHTHLRRILLQRTICARNVRRTRLLRFLVTV